MIAGATTNSYTPVVGVVVNKYLRVEATYKDSRGNEKKAMAASAKRVREAPASNIAPVATEATKFIDENSAPGTKVGEPFTATDTPGDVLTYTLSGTDGNDYRIDRASGQITIGPRTMLDHDEPGGDVDTVTVTATDPSGSTDDGTVTIMINDVNEAPTMTAGASRVSHDENMAIDTAVGSYTATDPEIGGGTCAADSCTWSVSGTDAGDFSISADTYGALTFKKVPNYEMPEDSNRDNVYMVKVVVTDIGIDGNNKMTAMREVTIRVMNLVEIGTVTLSSVQPKVGVPLTASVTDLDGGVKDITWKWYNGTINEGELAANAIAGATSDSYTPVPGNVGETLSARAMYTDGKGSDSASGEAANIVIVDLANRAPMFKKGDVEISTDTREVPEGTSADVAVGATVTATDPNNVDDVETDKLTYTLSGTDAASFTISSVSTPAGQISVGSGVKLDYETKKSYMVTVTATDPSGLSGSIDVTITVTDMDEAPMIMLGGLRISGMSMAYYEENRMDAVETYMASGPMASRARWSLAGDDAGDFMLDRDRVLKFRSSPNYEIPKDADTDNTYKVSVKANDGTHMAIKNVTVMVTDVEELGTLSGNSRHSYKENGEDAVGTYTPSGPDTATWSLEGTDKGYFTITDGMLKFRNSPNYEMPRRQALSDNNTNEYMVTVKAKAGGEMDEIMVTVTVANVEEIGTLSGSSSRSYMENSDDAVATYTADGSMADMATWSLSGTDRRDFTITGGILNFRSAPDYERPIGGSGNDSNTYMVTVKAEAGGEMDMVDVTITVTDENDPGTVSLSSMHPVVGVALTASLTDPDGSISGITWQWASSDTSGGTYININISGAMSASYTPVEADEGDYLRATASYTDGHGSGNTAFAKTAMTAAPVMLEISGPSDPSYTENGTDAIGPYTASGPGATSATWTLEGDDADDFVVEGSGASAMLKFSSPPDYENPTDMGTDNTYKVTVKANDGTYMDTHDVTVAVTNVEELGTLSGDSNPSYMENGDGAVGTYTASGPMSDVATWSLMGDDMDDLSISTGGELTFDATPDFEMPMDQDMDNTYKVTVMAKAGGEMKEIPVIVMVTNVDEMGEVTLWAGMDALTMAPQVGDTITGAVMDPDGGVTGETWQWSRTMDTADMTSWMDIQDATDAAYMVTAGDAGYYLRVMATYTDAAGTGMAMEYSPATMMVGAEAGDTLLGRYDENGNDEIDLDEVFTAINDYFEERLTSEEVFEIIDLYFES